MRHLQQRWIHFALVAHVLGAVFGGSLQIRRSAHVYGDVSVVGGEGEIATGAQVDGDIKCTGGGDRDDRAVAVVDHHQSKLVSTRAAGVFDSWRGDEAV